MERWKQRFESFDKALALLSGPLHEKKWSDFSDLEQEGLIQRFEYTFELAWKTVKDYLVFCGIDLQRSTPRDTIKLGFAAGVILDGQAWIDMLESRNLLSHTYNRQTFELTIQDIQDKYLSALSQVHDLLQSKMDEQWTLV